MRQTVDQTGIPRLLTVGAGPAELGKKIDYESRHGDFSPANRSERPVLMQEVYFTHYKEDPESERMAADDMRELFIRTIQNGHAGLAPWSWTRQMRLWQDNYELYPAFALEKDDDRLGCQVHDDGTIKPAGQAFRDLATLLQHVRFVDFDAVKGKIITERGEIIAKMKGPGKEDGYSLFHVFADGCSAAMALATISWQGVPLVAGPPEGYVYVFTEDGTHTHIAKHLYVKSDVAGPLRVYHDPLPPRSVRLVDLSSLGKRFLQDLPWSTKDGAMEVRIEPTQQAYWVQVEW